MDAEKAAQIAKLMVRLQVRFSDAQEFIHAVSCYLSFLFSFFLGSTLIHAGEDSYIFLC